jgi:tetratricopeptide (TPR) repeat protein
MQPDNALGVFWLGVTHMSQSEYPEAQKAFEEAARINPRMPSARLQLAKAFLADKKYDDALKVLRSILKQRSGSAAHRLTGDVYVAQGHYRQAIEEYQAALLHGDVAERYPNLKEIEKSSLADAAKAEAFRVAFEQVRGERSDHDRPANRTVGKGRRQRRNDRQARERDGGGVR